MARRGIMKTWDDVKKFILDKYKDEASNDENDGLKVKRNFKDGRSQVVHVNRLDCNETGNWVQIKSPCGLIDHNKLDSVLEYLNDSKCGGLVKIRGCYYIRHAMPIDDLSENEFDGPFRYVASYADHIEKKWVGDDK